MSWTFVSCGVWHCRSAAAVTDAKHITVRMRRDLILMLMCILMAPMMAAFACGAVLLILVSECERWQRSYARTWKVRGVDKRESKRKRTGDKRGFWPPDQLISIV
mmetsp:Transcript_20702/g.44752  ORF Transcript_20702/g.44752 Transcript_20702/m.44752 type:complete len:105 (-) Transcript_20702:1684-1998(-)